jgi:hypothetical protein
MKEMSESLWVVLGFVARKDRKTDKIRCGRNAMDSMGDSTISNSTHFRVQWLNGFWPLGNNSSIFIRGFLKDGILACVET